MEDDGMNWWKEESGRKREHPEQTRVHGVCPSQSPRGISMENNREIEWNRMQKDDAGRNVNTWEQKLRVMNVSNTRGSEGRLHRGKSQRKERKEERKSRGRNHIHMFRKVK